MRHNRSLFLVVIMAMLLLGACHRVPKHARLIPKDALAVIAINTGSISKEVAWSKITGSKILDELEQSAKDPKAKQGLKDIEHMGIDWMSTVYFYTRTDTRFQGSQRAVGLAPLKDAGEWEAWVKKVFPDAVIHTSGKLKGAMLNTFYAAWDGDVLMVMNSIVHKVPRQVRINVDSAFGGPGNVQEYTVNDEVPDETATMTEIEEAFKLKQDAAIVSNTRFNDLMREGHDVSFFVNYDNVMNSAAGMSSGLMGLSMGSALWKDAAMTGGIDFEKGQITGLFHYYSSDSLQGVAKAWGKDNVDGAMLERIPAENLNLAAGYHLSLPAVKLMLDRMGYTGLANIQLAQAGLTVDDILSAFTGDMAFSMNNFKVETEILGNDTISKALGMRPYPSTKPKMDYVFAMKINNRPAFDKLIALATRESGFVQSAPNTYMIGPAGALVVGDKYFAIGNNVATAQGYLQKSGTIPDMVKKEIEGHPFGFYADIQSFLTPARAAMSYSHSDSVAFTEAQRIFNNASMHGGEYRSGANAYTFNIRMMDKSENSLLQLIQMAERLSKAEH